MLGQRWALQIRQLTELHAADSSCFVQAWRDVARQPRLWPRPVYRRDSNMLNSILSALNKDSVGSGLVGGVAVLGHGGSGLTDSRSQKISVCGFELEGVSIAGQETCIVVPRFKVAFDSGRCPQRSVYQQTLLISHGHLDHVGGVPFHVSSRCMLGLPPSRVVVPHALEEGVRQLLETARQLQGEPPTPYELLALKVGQEATLASGFVARPFKTTHTIPSQGYIVYSQRKKLKAGLLGLSQTEIRDRRLAGEDVTDTVEVPEVAFTGDTTSEFFNGHGNEDVFRAKLLIIECTFIDDSVTVQQAKEKGHMHIADLVANAHLFQNEAIMLIHFSSRYSRSQIIDALNTQLPPSLRAKVVPFLNGFADSASHS